MATRKRISASEVMSALTLFEQFRSDACIKYMWRDAMPIRATPILKVRVRVRVHTYKYIHTSVACPCTYIHAYVNRPVRGSSSSGGVCVCVCVYVYVCVCVRRCHSLRRVMAYHQCFGRFITGAGVRS